MERLTVLLALMALDAGGAETHAISLAQQLKKRGVRVIVASHGGRLTAELEKSSIEHFVLPLNRKTPSSLICSARGLADIVRKYGVNIIHAHGRIPAWVAHWVTYLTGCPYITTSHGIYSTAWGMGFLTIWGKKVIAVSEDVKNHLINNFKVEPGKVCVIPNGIDLQKFDSLADSAPVLQELGIGPTDYKVVYISRLAGGRGEIALRLIEALPEVEQDFPNVKLIVVGEGEKYDAIKTLAEKYNTAVQDKKVILTGVRLDTPRLMNMADVAVGVGRVALEAMAMKKPVIIAGEAGFMGILTPEIFEKARKHNFSGRGSGRKTDAAALAEAIKKLLTDPSGSRMLGEFGRQAVTKHFSIESMTEEILKVYHQEIGEKK